MTAQEGITAIFRGIVYVLSEHDRKIRTPGIDMNVPSVVALKKYVYVDQTPAFTRFNLFLRDGCTCQYCADSFKPKELTFDHVIPRSKGGETSWENIVAACRSCNARKGDSMPDNIGMYPITPPRMPSARELSKKARKFPPHFLHESWRDFLYWDAELEEDSAPGMKELTLKPDRDHGLTLEM
jgi:5-methylcytosine-specific restriction endonuclease McrA